MLGVATLRLGSLILFRRQRPISALVARAANISYASFFKESSSIANHMRKKHFYAVVQGRQPGLYRSWPDCEVQVQRFSGAVFKGFETQSEALSYLWQHGVLISASGSQNAADAPVPKAESTKTEPIAHPPKKRRRKNTGTSNTVSGHDKRGKMAQPAAGAQPAEPGAASEDASRHRSPRIARVEFDGASKQNPGPAGFGAAVYDARTGKEVSRVWRYMGDRHTNNQAEYAGLIAGLRAALARGYDAVEVQGDSLLVISQLLGHWQVKHEGLVPYHRVATELKNEFKSFKAKHVPRADNKVADALSNQAIEEWRAGKDTQGAWSLAEGPKEKVERQVANGSADESDLKVL